MTIQTYRITMRSGPTPGKSYPLESEDVSVGRDLVNTIAIPDPEVSRKHAHFLVRPEGVMIEDLGSTNGTFINGVRSSSPQALKHGDVITFGESIVVVFEAMSYDPDATVVAGKTQLSSEPVQAFVPLPPVQPVQPAAPPPYVPPVQPAPPAQPVVRPVAPQPAQWVAPVPQPQPVMTPPPYVQQAPVEQKKKKKFPTWLLILLIMAIVACVVVGLVLTFMPATWWCALTFNSLPGCPIY